MSHSSARANTCPVKLHHIPGDLIRYHLLHFLNSSSAVKLTQTSLSLFHALRHKIHRTEFVRIDRFIQQSLTNSSCIGVFSNVCTITTVAVKDELHRLSKHCADYNIVKVYPLLELIINSQHPVGDIILPTSLHLLEFGGCFDQSIAGITLPDNLHTLTFGCDFNKSLADITLPVNLHTLTFGHNFNQSLADITLPVNLQVLNFGYYFNQSLTGLTLPPSLHTLSFGTQFNLSLADTTLPASLHTLIFGHWFNQSLTGIALPASLETLDFGYYFNQPMTGLVVLTKLRTLTFGACFNQTLVGIQLSPNLVIHKRGLPLASELLPPGLQIVSL